jgi:hypothetical protein
MDDLTLIVCSYNTPDITLTMLKSWMHVHNKTQRLVLCDNSTNNDTKDLLYDHKVPYTSNPGMTHGDGVNECLKLCKTKYALLVDTDIIFLKDHSTIFQQFKDMDLTIMGKVEGDRGSKSIYNRVNPWHCFIDVEKIKQHNIIFFDKEKMKASFKTNKIYDIGSTFLESIKENKLKIGNVDLLNNYYIHLEGMSWYKNKYDGSKEDTGIDFGGTHNSPAYVNAYDQKYLNFKNIKQKYKDVKITNKFIYEEPKLLIKFPTRGRVKKFFKTLDEYYKLLSGKYNVEFLITCDNDDVTMNNIEIKTRLKKYSNLKVEYGDNKNKVEAINAGINNKDFQILLLASDDMVPIVKGYDSIIVKSMCSSFPDFDGIVWFNDGIQQNRLNTLCILGKTYYNRFNYIYNAAYKSLWCDAEFTHVGNMLGKQKYFDQVIIRHDHHSITKTGFDEIYNKNEIYESEDKNTFLIRQANNFK